MKNNKKQKDIFKLTIGIWLTIIYFGPLLIGPASYLSNYEGYFESYIIRNVIGFLLGILLIIRSKKSSVIVKIITMAIVIAWLVFSEPHNLYKPTLLLDYKRCILVGILHIPLIFYLLFYLINEVKSLFPKWKLKM